MRRMALIAAVLCSVLIWSLAFLLFSKPGLNLAISLISSLSNGIVIVEQGEGSILGGWQLEGVAIVTPEVTISIQELACDWKPAELLRKNLHLAEISARDVLVTLAEEEYGTETKGQQLSLPTVMLPVGILIKQLIIDGGLVRKADSVDDVFSLDSLSLALSGQQDHLQIDKLKFDTPGYGVELEGALQMSGDWPFTGDGLGGLNNRAISGWRGIFRLQAP